MALNLLSLLQAVAGQDAQQLPEEEEIVVQAPRRQPASSKSVNFPAAPDAPVLTNGPDAPDFGNRSYVEAARAAMQNVPERSGMFGTRGTLRDILGTLGDAFLLQSGNKAMYAPQRELERNQDALSGFTANPAAAVERLAQFGDPEFAAKLYDMTEANRLRQTQIQGMNDARISQSDKRNFDKRETGLNRMSRWVRGGLPFDKIVAAAKKYDITPEELAELGVTPDMTAEQRSQFASGDMTVNQQEQIPLRKEQLDISRQNAVSSRIRANRPPAGRAAPQPTNAAMAAPLIAKVKAGKSLTPGETETLNRLGYSADRGKGRTKRTPPPLPPGFKIR